MRKYCTINQHTTSIIINQQTTLIIINQQTTPIITLLHFCFLICYKYNYMHLLVALSASLNPWNHPGSRDDNMARRRWSTCLWLEMLLLLIVSESAEIKGMYGGMYWALWVALVHVYIQSLFNSWHFKLRSNSNGNLPQSLVTEGAH